MDKSNGPGRVGAHRRFALGLGLIIFILTIMPVIGGIERKVVVVTATPELLRELATGGDRAELLEVLRQQALAAHKAPCVPLTPIVPRWHAAFLEAAYGQPGALGDP